MQMTAYGPSGFGELVSARDNFKCNSSICYGIGVENHKRFQNLQSLLNLFATPVGFAPLVVDGFLGDASAKAAELTARAIVGSGLPGADSAVVQKISGGISKNGLAEAAFGDFPLMLAAAGPVMQAQRAQSGLPASPYVAPTPITAATAPAAVTPGPEADKKMKSMAPSNKKWLWWTLAGVATVAAVGGVGYVVYRRQAKPARRMRPAY